MKRKALLSVAGILLISWTVSGCVWINGRHDNGLHKGQTKQKGKKFANGHDASGKQR